MQLNEAKVLVVDDEPALRQIFAKWLETMGCLLVKTAEDGEAALGVLQAESFDLLISDVRMPRMDGITLVRRLAEVERSIPSIIFVSGFGDVDEREMYGQGVEAFLAKPLRMDELMDVIRRALADRSVLWTEAMPVAPRQRVHLETSLLDDRSLRLGRGGFSVGYSGALSLGKVTFACTSGSEHPSLCGQGLVRWRSRTDLRVGIEFVYLDEPSRMLVLEAISRERPRSFIPS